jgi:uncharacterized peroxidase-related enzyme
LTLAIENDFANAKGLSDKRKTMLSYALKLTQSPQSMRRQDVTKLRDVGYSDTDILHIAEVTAYYAYVNRIADGLGVEIEGA